MDSINLNEDPEWRLNHRAAYRKRLIGLIALIWIFCMTMVFVSLGWMDKMNQKKLKELEPLIHAKEVYQAEQALLGSSRCVSNFLKRLIALPFHGVSLNEIQIDRKEIKISGSASSQDGLEFFKKSINEILVQTKWREIEDQFRVSGELSC